jgi:hypothetical protein
LIKNALEAAPEQSTVKIFLSQNQQYAGIEIYNQGEVPLGIRAHFFEKYITNKPGGTGLGTYSAYLAVKTQHGHIQMDCSELGATRLIVQLPLSNLFNTACSANPLGSSAEATIKLATDVFTAVPTALQEELYDAVESLESERIETAIVQVRLYNPSLSKQLMELANNYDYLAILTALESFKKYQ